MQEGNCSTAGTCSVTASYRLVCAVCGEGRALSDLFPVKRSRLTAADNLRAALDDMACMWGYMQRKRVDNGNHVAR